jgi:hypothetical protein
MSSMQSKIIFPEDVLFHEVGGEAVILNLESGKYFGLDEVGTRMWVLLSEHGAIEPVVSALLEEYEVEEEQLRADLSKLIDDLASHGLLQLDPA